jgi:hypothetical protein
VLGDLEGLDADWMRGGLQSEVSRSERAEVGLLE